MNACRQHHAELIQNIYSTGVTRETIYIGHKCRQLIDLIHSMV